MKIRTFTLVIFLTPYLLKERDKEATMKDVEVKSKKEDVEDDDSDNE